MNSPSSVNITRAYNLTKVSALGVDYKRITKINKRCPLTSTSNVNISSDSNSNQYILSCESPYSVILTFDAIDNVNAILTPNKDQKSTKVKSQYAIVLDFKKPANANIFFAQLPIISRLMIDKNRSMRFCLCREDLNDGAIVSLQDIQDAVALNDGGNAFLTHTNGKYTVTILSSDMRFLPKPMPKPLPVES